MTEKSAASWIQDLVPLFISVLANLELAVLIILLFTCCLLFLTVSLVTFIMEIRLSLKALKLELRHDVPSAA